MNESTVTSPATTTDVAVATGAANVITDPDAIKKALRNKARPTRYWDWADRIGGDMLEDAFPTAPLSIRATAAATCRFEFRGKHANGNDWGLGALTHMQTYGHVPDGVGKANQPCVQIKRNMIELNAHESADIILACFDLTVDEVYDRFGAPNEYERFVIDLYQILSAMRPEYINPAAADAA
jgi:hypothetical protein